MVAVMSRLPRPVELEVTECALTVEQLVARIQEFNPTASVGYLGRFSPAALERYLAHLCSASEPRGRAARWERPGDTPAIVCFGEAHEE